MLLNKENLLKFSSYFWVLPGTLKFLHKSSKDTGYILYESFQFILNLSYLKVIWINLLLLSIIVLIKAG